MLRVERNNKAGNVGTHTSAKAIVFVVVVLFVFGISLWAEPTGTRTHSPLFAAPSRVDTAAYRNYPFIRFVDRNADSIKISDEEFYDLAGKVIFPINKYDLPKNDSLVMKLETEVFPLINRDSLELAYMILRGAASPEGPTRFNKFLGEKRAETILNFIKQNIRVPENLDMEIDIEDYRTLCLMMRRMGDKDYGYVQAMCDQYLPKNPVKLKATLRAARQGTLWLRLFREYFPRLRAARIIFFFHAPRSNKQPQVIVPEVVKPEIIKPEVEEPKPVEPEVVVPPVVVPPVVVPVEEKPEIKEPEPVVPEVVEPEEIIVPLAPLAQFKSLVPRSPFMPEAEVLPGIPVEYTLMEFPQYVLLPLAPEEGDTLLRYPRRELLSVKTNLLFYGVYMPGYNRWCPIPNVAIEYYPLRGHFTFGASFDCPWWQNYSGHKYFQVRNYQLEARYYFRRGDIERRPEGKGAAFKGLYLQAYGNATLFGICFDQDRGWVGEGGGGGLGVGYVMPLSKKGHWRLDFQLQVGLFFCKYDPYQYLNPFNREPDDLYYYKWTQKPELFKKRQYQTLWLGPTRIGVTLSYDLLYRKARNKKEGWYDPRDTEPTKRYNPLVPYEKGGGL